VLDTANRWLGVGPLAAAAAAGIAESVFGIPGFYDVLDIQAPVGLVVALEGGSTRGRIKPIVGFTIGLRSTQDARELLGRGRSVTELPRGAYRVELEIADEDFVCEISEPSLNRLACGAGERDVRALGPYLTRGFPVADLPDRELYGEVRLARIREAFGTGLEAKIEFLSSMIGHQYGSADRAMQGAILDGLRDASAETIRLANDVDVLRFEGQTDTRAKAVTIKLGLSFHSQASWVTQRFFDNSRQVGAPPPIFWSAPADSASAFFYRESKEQNFELIRRHITNLLSAALGSSNVPTADQKGVVDLVSRSLGDQPTMVYATGVVLPKVGPGASETDRKYDEISSNIGWSVVGVEEPSKRIDTWLTDAARLYSRPGVQRGIRELADTESARLPRITYGPLNVAGLPGLKAMQISMPAALLRQPKSAPPLVGYLLLWSDGNRTWLASGIDRAVLETQLKAIKAGGASTIASKAGLEELRSGQMVGGGYLSMASVVTSQGASWADIVGGAPSQRPDRASQSMRNWRDRLARSPTRGTTPIVVKTMAVEGTTPEVWLEIKVPKDVVADFGLSR